MKEPIKKKRIAIELNSHSLSYFQQCEQRFDYSNQQLLVSKDDYYPFKRGAGISRVLAIWYLARKRNYSEEKLRKLERFLFKKMCASSSFFNERYDIDDRVHIASRLVGYFNKYRNEVYPIIAVEKGFSKIIYEDSSVLFVYSGKPDLVVDFGSTYGIGPIDHKSESRANDLTVFQNQFVGYAWALNAKVGLINYIGLQANCKDNDVLRRSALNFTEKQIEKWKEDTIKWFYRILRSIADKKYLRSWQCDSKYGTCLYHQLCTSSTRAEELIKINRDFNQLEEPYKSW